MKKFITGALAAALTLAFAIPTFACTGTYVGKYMTEDGSRMVARTEDIGGGHTKRFEVIPRTTYKNGEYFVDEQTGFKYPQPTVAYKYTAVPDSEVEDDGIYAEIGFNEYGVAVDATVSASPNEEVLAVDPLVDDGLREANIPTIVLPRVQTAREGVELIASIVEEQGAAEGNVLMIADKNEAWYMEIYSGHRYAAIKMPDDVVSVFPNCFMLDYVDLSDTENVIASADLIDFAKENGFYKEYNGKFHAALSYGEELTTGNRDRLWGGINFLAPELNIPYDAEVFPLFFKPSEKIALKDVMELQRYRYEGTERDPETATDEVRVIGTERQAECHILQFKDEYPTELGGVMWMTMGNAEHSVYLPTYGNITETNEEYLVKTADYDANSAYWKFRSLSTLAELNREKYGQGVRDFWSTYEDMLIEKQEEADKEIVKLYESGFVSDAQKFATELGMSIADDAMEKADTMFNELMQYVATEAGRANKNPYTPSITLENTAE